MKLYKIENENEIWYFTTKSKCSRYLGCSIQNIDTVLEGRSHRAKGYTVEVIEDDYVMSKFIDPEKNNDEEQVYIKCSSALWNQCNNNKVIIDITLKLTEKEWNILLKHISNCTIFYGSEYNGSAFNAFIITEAKMIDNDTFKITFNRIKPYIQD